MMDTNKAKSILLRGIKKSFDAYKIHGARSNKKLIPLHGAVVEIVASIFGLDFSVKSINNRELKVEGRYYPKNIDVVVIDKKEKPIFCLGVKFITSNYKQNANNYFENMMGETANIQANNIPYAQLIILRHQTPYYKKNNNQKSVKIEKIGDKDVVKYSRLSSDVPQAHKPIATALYLVDVNEVLGTVVQNSLSDFGEGIKGALRNKLSINNLLNEILGIKQSLSLK